MIFSKMFTQASNLIKKRAEQKNEITMLRTLLGLTVTGILCMAVSNNGLRHAMMKAKRKERQALSQG